MISDLSFEAQSAIYFQQLIHTAQVLQETFLLTACPGTIRASTWKMPA